MDDIWIVSYMNANDISPTITAFSNEDAAYGCYKYFSKYHNCCWINKLPVYSHFLTSEEK